MNNSYLYRMVAAASLLVVLVIGGCGGAPIPESLRSAGGDGGEQSQTGEATIADVAFEVTPSVFGEDGSGSSAARKYRKGSGSQRSPAASRRLGGNRASQTSAATDDSDNGNGRRDIVDLEGNNMFTSGLSSAPLEAVIRFIAQGSQNLLAEYQVGQQGGIQLKGKDLGAGQNLQVDILIGGTPSTAIVPSSFFQDGEKYGFTIIRRADGSLVLEIFVDSHPPFNVSDNGARVIIDTAADALGTGERIPAARFETPDGLVLWDINLDGRFGTPDDGCRLFDTNGDGVVDEKDALTSLAVDPNLDGTQGPDEERLLGSNIPEDFINGIEMVAVPAKVVGNGVSSITVATDVVVAFDGSPIGGILTYSLETVEGTLSGEAEKQVPASFVRSGQSVLPRTLDPGDPTVQVLADGRIRLIDTFRPPVMATAGILRLTLSYRTSVSQEPVKISLDIELTENTSPSLANVNFIGTLPIPGGIKSLKDASDAARVVEGNLVQLVGTNFSTDLSALTVAFGGTIAVVNDVNAEGTVITTRVPVGAATGPISVFQGDSSAQTKEPFVVAGPPLGIDQSTPGNGETGVGRDVLLAIRFNQPISQASLENGFYIIQTGGVRVVGSATVSDDGLTLSFVPSENLDANTEFRVLLGGGLTASNGVRFDANLDNATVAEDEADAAVLIFTTGTGFNNDTTPPMVLGGDADTHLDPPTEEREGWSMSIGLSEVIAPASVFASSPANSADSIRLRRDSDDSLVDLAVALDATQTAVEVIVRGRIRGSERYTLIVSREVADLSGNGLASDFSKAFDVPLRIDRLSSISGPVESEVIVYGSTFTVGSTTVEFNGVAAEVVESDEDEISVKVPAGATDGSVRVTVGNQTADSPRPFVVTSAGFPVRHIVTGKSAFGIAIDNAGRAMVNYPTAASIGFVDIVNERAVDVNPATSAVDDIEVGGVPTEAILDRGGKYGFTTNFGTTALPGRSVFFIDLASNSIAASVQVGQQPTRLAVTPDNRYLLVTNFMDNTMSVVDIADFAVITTVATGQGPNGVAVAPDGRRAYVCNFVEGTVSIFETATWTVTGIVVVGTNPARAMLSPDSGTLVVSNFGAASVTVLDTRSLSVLQTIDGLNRPSAMTFSPDGKKLFIANRGSNTIVEYAQDSATLLWNATGLKLATPETPAGIAVTADGAVLAFTTQTGGTVSVVRLAAPQPVVEGFALDALGAPGSATFSSDPRQRIWVLGRGFGTDSTRVEVTLNGSPLTVESEGYARTQFVVQIPEGAQSGPLVVTRLGATPEQNRVSNSLALTITPKSPMVIQMLPGPGAFNVSPTTNIVFTMNEPLDLTSIFDATGKVLTVQDRPVIRLVRVAEQTGVANTVVRGTWTVDAAATTFRFTLAEGETLLAGRSNNFYDVVVSKNVRDLFGNAVLGAATTTSADTAASTTDNPGFRGRFQTKDLLGPKLVSARYRDVDNNGVDEGDELMLQYSEDLFFAATSFDLKSAISLGGAGGSLGSTFSGTLGSSPRRVLMTLGANANLTLGAAGTTLTMIDEVVTAFSDYAGTRPIAGDPVAIAVDRAADNGDNPRLLVAAWLDRDNSNSVTVGDRLNLMFSEPVLLGSASSGGPASLVTLSGAATLGSSSFAARASGQYRVLTITLAADASFTPGTTTLTLNGSGTPPVMAAESILDFAASPAYAGEYGRATIVAGIPGEATLDAAVKPELLDIAGTETGPSKGDILLLTFTNPVVVNPLAIATGTVRPRDIFALGVDSDRFGANARIVQPPYVELTNGTRRSIAPNELGVLLGDDPVLTPRGNFGQ